MSIDNFRVFLEWGTKIILVYFFYIPSLFGITLLSIKQPILQEFVVWGFTLVPNILSNIIGKPLLKNMINDIGIKKKEISVNTGLAYPSLLFRFCMDSKAPIEFKPIELTAYVYLESANMGKIHWSKHEKRESQKNIGLIDVGFTSHFESDEVPNLEAKSECWVKLYFIPPREVYKPKYRHKWTIETTITFSTKLGECSKFFSVTFDTIKKDKIERIEKSFLRDKS